MTRGPVRLRDVAPIDLPTILRLVRALAEYESLPVTATVDDLHAGFFGSPPRIHGVLAERDGQAVALATWYATFGTFAGRASLYIEDLFVDPVARGQGVGRALLAHLARVTCAGGYARMDWAVLNWNETALRFYRSAGAAPVTEWTVQRLAGDALAALAAEGEGQDG